MMRLPSGETATEVTGPVWPVSGSPIGAPVARSHTRTVVSWLPLMMRLPSGDTATDRTNLTSGPVTHDSSVKGRELLQWERWSPRTVRGA